jgi:transcriptional regulator with XRE-family HTH domain
MMEDRVRVEKKSGRSLTGKKTGGARLSATLDSGLRRYAIAERLRGLRLKKKMGLVELGRHTGLSPALLSKLERGRLYPTLPTLLRIALVFGVGLEYFFSGPREQPVIAVVRRKERVRLPDRPGSPDVNYYFESLDYPAVERRLNAYIAEFPPLAPEKIRVHTHEGFEVLYVLAGELEITFGEERHLLEAGDSVYFDASVPHGYRRHGRRGACSAIVVTAR